MERKFELLNDEEVLYVEFGRVLMANPTFKVGEFLDALMQLVSDQEEEWSDEHEGWFVPRGQNCEVLRFSNQGWQRGRVRIRLEFCPEDRPKLLRESVQRRDNTTYQREDTYSRQNRENIYQRDDFSQRGGQPLYPREDIYPDVYPDDQDY
jgi:hypothetical protein